MRHLTLLAAALLSLGTIISCQRDPIYDSVSKYRFEFDIDENVLYCDPPKTELIQVLFYDPQTGKKIDETYMSPDGGYLYSIQPGYYDIVVFSMGSDRTDITYTKDLNLLTAETKTLQSTPVRIINAPGHVFTGAAGNVMIPHLSEADSPFILRFPMKSICDSWKIMITGVEGLEYASSVWVYVFNQREEILLKDMTPTGSCAIRASGKALPSEGVLESQFCTFGMINDGQPTVKVVIEAQDGRTHSMDFDVTRQVWDESNSSHIITVDFPTKLLPLKQGGLDPSADEWDDNHEFIDIK